MLYRAYPPAERVHVARMVTRVMVLAPATAPIIGGVLVTQLSWHWIFLVNVPVGAILLVFGARFLAEHREPRSRHFDLAGFVLGGPGLALALYAVSEGSLAGWGSPKVVGSATVGGLLLGLFVRIELRLDEPILRLRLFADQRLFRRCCVLFACSSPAFFGSLVFLAIYLQEGRGYSALVSGLTTFPEAVAIGLSSQIVARLYPTVGPRRLILGGFLGLTVVTVLLSFAGDATSLWLIRGLAFCLGVSVSYVMLPVQAAAFAQITSEDTGQASAIFNTLQRTAAAVGVAVLSAVLAFGTHGAIRPPISAFRAVYLTAAGFAATGALVALGVRDEDAAATMVSGRTSSPAASDGPSRPTKPRTRTRG